MQHCSIPPAGAMEQWSWGIGCGGLEESSESAVCSMVGVYATSDEMQPATNVADALLIRLDFFFDFFDLVAFGFGVCRLQPNAATFGALT